MTSFWEKYDFNQLINIALEDKFSDFGKIAGELPGTTKKHPPLSGPMG